MVKLIKQSYLEAKTSGSIKEELELIELVSVSGSCMSPFHEDTMNATNKKLVEKAEELGADYIFGIEYKGTSPSHTVYDGGILVYGDAYKSN